MTFGVNVTLKIIKLYRVIFKYIFICIDAIHLSLFYTVKIIWVRC